MCMYMCIKELYVLLKVEYTDTLRIQIYTNTMEKTQTRASRRVLKKQPKCYNNSVHSGIKLKPACLTIYNTSEARKNVADKYEKNSRDDEKTKISHRRPGSNQSRPASIPEKLREWLDNRDIRNRVYIDISILFHILSARSSQRPNCRNFFMSRS